MVLLRSTTGVKWFHNYVWDKENHKPRDGVQIRFIESRIRFVSSSDPETKSPPFDSVVVVFGPPRKGDDKKDI